MNTGCPSLQHSPVQPADVAVFRFWGFLLFLVSLLADGASYLVSGYSNWWLVFWGNKSLDGVIIQWSIPLTLATLVLLLARIRPCSLAKGAWLLGAGVALMVWLVTFDSYQLPFFSFGTKLGVLMLPLSFYLALKALHYLWLKRRVSSTPVWVPIWLCMVLTIASLIVATGDLRRFSR